MADADKLTDADFYVDDKGQPLKDATPAPVVTDDMRSVTADVADVQRRKIGEEEKIGRETIGQAERDRDRAAGLLSREGVGPDDVKKWDADAEARKYSTNPVESFGSFASMFAIAASAFTRAPMQNALNGAAAAMNAVKARDDQAYDRAYKAWKDNTDLVIKRHQMMHQDYQDAISLLNTDMTIGEAKLKELGARYGDQQMLTLLEHGYYPQLFELMQSRSKAVDGMIETSNKLDKFAIQKQVYDSDPRAHSDDPRLRYYAFIDAHQMDLKDPIDLQVFNKIWADPEMKGLSQDEAFKKFNEKWGEYQRQKYAGRGITETRVMLDRAAQIADEEKIPIEEALARVKAATARPTMAGEQAKLVEDKVRQKIAAGMDETKAREEAIRETRQATAAPLTGNQRIRVEAQIQQYKESMDTIDKVLGVLDKYVYAAGAPGMATRTAERISDLLGSNKTDRVQMQRDIQYLKLNAPRLLLDISTGRPLSAEASQVNDIIAGLSLGDTTANTKRALQDVKARYQRLMEGNQQRIGETPTAGTETPTAQPVAPPEQPRWMSAPKVQ